MKIWDEIRNYMMEIERKVEIRKKMKQIKQRFPDIEKRAIVYGFHSLEEAITAKMAALEPIWGYMYRGNGYGWWNLGEAIKRKPKDGFIWVNLDGDLHPVGNEYSPVWEVLISIVEF